MPIWHHLKGLSPEIMEGKQVFGLIIGLMHQFCRRVHHEFQPHTWAASWTTERNESFEGSNFYNATYRVRVQGASNTACFWQPEHFHGTSLANNPYSEKEGDLVQCGLALITAPRLPSAWKKFKEAEGDAKKLVVQDILKDD